MSELEERISSVLNDPEQLARISAMAQQLMGGETEKDAPVGAPGAEAPKLDFGALLRGGLGGKSRQIRMLETLVPCLDEKRAAKLRRAIGAARVFSVVRTGLRTEIGNV